MFKDIDDAISKLEAIADPGPMVTITIQVPAKEIDLHGCSIVKDYEPVEAWGGKTIEPTYEIDIDDAKWNGYGIEEICEKGRDILTDRMIEEFGGL